METPTRTATQLNALLTPVYERHPEARPYGLEYAAASDGWYLASRPVTEKGTNPFTRRPCRITSQNRTRLSLEHAETLALGALLPWLEKQAKGRTSVCVRNNGEGHVRDDEQDFSEAAVTFNASSDGGLLEAMCAAALQVKTTGWAVFVCGERVGAEEWYVALNDVQAGSLHGTLTGEGDSLARRLTDKEMAETIFEDDDGSLRSFAQELKRRVDAGLDAPEYFASYYR